MMAYYLKKKKKKKRTLRKLIVCGMEKGTQRT